ncbi:MAG: cobalamin B12-binding domain-containing protein, partial [Fervidobacterium sp.]
VLKFKEKGIVVLGTAKNDVHNIGKNLVAAMLDLYGYKVVDIGEDVDAEKFVSAAKAVNAHIIGVSALLAMTADYSKVVVNAFEKAGMRDKVKIIAGGAPVTPDLAKRCGVDGYARDAVGAVKLVDALMKGEKIETIDAVVF